jgi:hypothetical protein
MRPSAVLSLLVVAGAYIATFAAVAGPAALAFGLPSQLIFLLPGVLIVRAIAPASGWLPPVAFGPLLGQALGSFVLTILWVAGGRGVWTIAAAPLMVAALIWPARRLAGQPPLAKGPASQGETSPERPPDATTGRFRVPVTDSGDLIALTLLLLLVPLIAGLPFAHVGELGPNGQDYRQYFTADYVWRRAVVIELAKGDALPLNPYFRGDALHYYWMPHLLSGVQYRFAGNWATLDELLLIRSVSINTVLIAFLYGMVRTFSVRPWAAAAGVGFVVLSSSFEGLYAMIEFARNGASIREVRNLNIDAITRWWFQAIPIDGLQRLLFYQPHHAVGYGIGLIGLLAIARRTRSRDGTVFCIAGTCLGLSVAISSFAGGMITVAAAIHEAIAVIRAIDWRRAFVHAIAAAIPLAIGTGVTYALKYVDNSGAVVAFELNRMATRGFWWNTFLSFGPVLLLCLAAVPAVRRERRGLGIFAALGASCVVFYFFINVRDHQDVYVGWRVGHLMFMAATVVIAILFERLHASPPSLRPLAWTAVSVIGLMGLPTTAIDVYNTQDTTNFAEAPAGPWTLRLTPDDLQIFDWLKHNTEATAIVQVDPVPRDPSSWAYMPAFGERRMAAGLPISMIPLAKYQEASHEVRHIFDEPPLFAYERAVRAGISYIIVGPPERRVHDGVEARFDSVPELMPLVFKNGTISIYHVKGSGIGSQGSVGR